MPRKYIPLVFAACIGLAVTVALCAVSPEYLASHRGARFWGILLGGFLFTAFFVGYLKLFIDREEKARRHADEALNAKTDLQREMDERKRAEEELRESEEKYRQLFENDSNAVMLFDAETLRFEDVNPAALEMFGYSKEEFLSLTPVDLSAERSETLENMKKIQDGNLGKMHVSERKFRKKDGMVFIGDINARTFTSKGKIKIIGSTRDITERKKAKEALEESEAQFRGMANAATDAIIRIDNDGKIAFWNPAAEKIFGYTTDEAVGKELHTLIGAKKYREAYKQGFSRFRETGEGPAIGKVLQFDAVKKDGTELPIEVSVSPIRIKDKWHAVGIVRDITERKKFEEALLEAERVAARSMVAAEVAHEMNNSMANVETAIYILKDMRSEGDTHRQSILSGIGEELERMAVMVRSLLEVQRKDDLVIRPVDINAEITKIINITRRRLAGNGISIEQDFSPGLPLIPCYPGHIKQLILNLVKNAEKAMASCEKKLISITTRRKDGFVIIEVSDTGCGIRETDRKKAFVKMAISKAGGMGLGLSICRQIVEKYGGDIKFENEEEGGTTVSIILPTTLPIKGNA